MNKELAEQIQSDPDFQALVRHRTRTNWIMAITVIVVYFAFILMIAYFPKMLGTKIAAGSEISVGIVAGFLIIVFSFLMTGLYVRKANATYDALTARIKETAQ
ncbi:hypothetical protein A9404_05040 [Halothiobacillus diazotrophicus]|uniref:DUF485 domain-containing protein n=1 Tax=Halothiobacillus diazotrophicus TaxID=1860122 RepID=A0A191ZG16_9GAMM|nr:DUF485 domain-containing protein [Halothiobacillus diazotrophicus]ANJ66826.1 hypothetical protein A9404_05040 [Halothiobacillus diazotrophicus]